MPIDVVLDLDSGACPFAAVWVFTETEGYFEGVRCMRAGRKKCDF